MGTVKVIKANSDTWKEYDKRMKRAEAAAGETETATSDYWWALWEIKSSKLYLAAFDTEEEWTKCLATEPWGPSHGQLYAVFESIRNLQTIGLTERRIQILLGKQRTAFKSDLDSWFDRAGNLLPEVEQRMIEGGTTPKEVVLEAADLSKGEARKHVKQWAERDNIFFLADKFNYNEKLGQMQAYLRWENEDDGLIWAGTVTIKVHQEAPEDGHDHLPEPIAKFLIRKMGLMG